MIRESIEILERLDNPIELAFAYNGLTLAAYYLNRPGEVKDAAQGFLRTANSLDDKWLLAYGLWLASLARLSGQNDTESKQFAEASFKISEEIQDKICSAQCLDFLGIIAMIQGELTKAKYYLTRCRQISKELGFLWLFNNATKYLG